MDPRKVKVLTWITRLSRCEQLRRQQGTECCAQAASDRECPLSPHKPHPTLQAVSTSLTSLPLSVCPWRRDLGTITRQQLPFTEKLTTPNFPEVRIFSMPFVVPTMPTKETSWHGRVLGGKFQALGWVETWQCELGSCPHSGVLLTIPGHGNLELKSRDRTLSSPRDTTGQETSSCVTDTICLLTQLLLQRGKGKASCFPGCVMGYIKKWIHGSFSTML
jgi:hypothetical protein